MQYRDDTFHPRQLAKALASTIDCFACGHGYTFVGDGVHPGVCERCGERAVSPAGVLDVTGEHVDRNFDGSETLTLDAQDDSGREFTFTVEVGDGAPCLRAVEIAGKRVRPDSPYWGSAIRFDEIEQAVAAYVGDVTVQLVAAAEDGGQA